MNISQRKLQSLLRAAYAIGYEDRLQQEGYNIAALQVTTPGGEVARSRLVDPRIHKRPKHTPKSQLLALATKMVEAEQEQEK